MSAFRRILAAIVVAVAIAALCVGCGGSGADGVRRAVSLQVDDFPDSLGVITQLPCDSRIDSERDPDNIAPGLATAKLQVAFEKSSGHPTRRVSQAEIVEKALTEDLAKFYRNWLGNPEEGDSERIRNLALRLRAETLLVGGVQEWQQSDKHTRIGMAAGLFDGATGRLLWWSEQAREVSAPRDDPAAGPVDFATVMDKVVEALVEAFPTVAATSTPSH